MKLYSRHECPLCEDAEDILTKFNINYSFIDIDLDPDLKKIYHVRVPVLVNDANQELAWPFAEDQLLEFCS